MSNKVRLISTISAICMVLALLTVGVWAVSTASVTLGGSVSFTADNIHARVTGSVTGTQETISLAELDYSADTAPSEANINTWANNQMTFTSENLITMTITVENLSEERSLFVTLTDNVTGNNISRTCMRDSTSYTSLTVVEVAAKGSTTFKMTMFVSDQNKSASATISYQVDLRDANYEEPIELLHDTENDYYFVEMGTYNSNPVRWRVVGVDGEHYQYNESQAPTGELTFIQETKTISYDFIQREEDSNSYYGSNIRKYLVNENTGGYINQLKISTDNALYRKILGRSWSDLYTDIVWRIDDAYQLESEVISFSGTDKLWLPSVKEIYTLVGGGQIINNDLNKTISETWDSSVMNNLVWHSTKYWLRTPGVYDYLDMIVITETGGYAEEYVLGINYYLRPMFLLNV